MKNGKCNVNLGYCERKCANMHKKPTIKAGAG